jgi:hypothetical protein
VIRVDGVDRGGRCGAQPGRFCSATSQSETDSASRRCPHTPQTSTRSLPTYSTHRLSGYIAGDSSSDRREDTQSDRSRAIRPAPCAPGRAATPVVAMGFSVHRRKKASFARLLLATFRNPFPRTSTPHTWPHGSPVFHQRPCGLDWWQINSSWPLFLLFLLQFMGGIGALVNFLEGLRL